MSKKINLCVVLLIHFVFIIGCNNSVGFKSQEDLSSLVSDENQDQNTSSSNSQVETVLSGETNDIPVVTTPIITVTDPNAPTTPPPDPQNQLCQNNQSSYMLLVVNSMYPNQSLTENNYFLSTYEGLNTEHGSEAINSKAVEVFIEEGTKPINLILNSYEIVNWKFTGSISRVKTIQVSNFYGVKNVIKTNLSATISYFDSSIVYQATSAASNGQCVGDTSFFYSSQADLGVGGCSDTSLMKETLNLIAMQFSTKINQFQGKYNFCDGTRFVIK